MSTLNVIYSPEDSDLSYGYFHCPECKSSFFGGGEALHRGSCSKRETECEGLDYVIGIKAFTSVMSGEDRINPITVEDLKRCLPQMVAIYRKQQELRLRPAEGEGVADAEG